MASLKNLGFASMTAVRFALGTIMIGYGIQKLTNKQIQLGAWSYAQPLGESSGVALTWAFLGYSPMFQFLLGAFEAIPGLLLLFARTRRIGALLMFPVLANVVMINFFLHLWLDTRWLSSILLALNTFLILYDFEAYWGIASHLLTRPHPIANRKLRLTAKLAAFAFPAAVIGLLQFWGNSVWERQVEPITDFIGRRQYRRVQCAECNPAQAAPVPRSGDVAFNQTKCPAGRKPAGLQAAKNRSTLFQP
jgi:DoxX